MRVGVLHPGSADLQIEDAGRSVVPLRVLVLHLGGVLTDVQVPRHKFNGARTGQEVKDPGQGACSPRCREPSRVSQEQATPQER